MSTIADLFIESPFEPICRHMDKVMECVGHLTPMFELVHKSDFERLEELAKTVFKAEHEADLVKDEIRQTIPKSFFVPVHRGDLLGYLASQDSIADAVEDVAFLLTIKKLSVPVAMADRLFHYVDSIVWVAQQAHEVSRSLSALVAEGFSVAPIEKVMKVAAAVEQAETEADHKQFELCQTLFAQEDELRDTDIMLWFRVFAVLGELADSAKDAAERVRRMLAP